MIHEKELAAEIVRAVSPAPSTAPKPRIRMTDPVTYQCGWCGTYDVAENLRTNILTGNNWPIHPRCVEEWYDGGDPENVRVDSGSVKK